MLFQEFNSFAFELAGFSSRESVSFDFVRVPKSYVQPASSNSFMVISCSLVPFIASAPSLGSILLHRHASASSCQVNHHHNNWDLGLSWAGRAAAPPKTLFGLMCLWFLCFLVENRVEVGGRNRIGMIIIVWTDVGVLARAYCF